MMSPLERLNAIQKATSDNWLDADPDSGEEQFWDGYMSGFEGGDITTRRTGRMFEAGLREGMWVHQRLSTDYLDTGA